MDFLISQDGKELLIETLEKGYDEEFLEKETRRLSNYVVCQLIAERKRRRMTQQDVADIIGLPRANVSRIERQLYTPTLGILMKYAACLGLKLTIGLESNEE